MRSSSRETRMRRLTRWPSRKSEEGFTLLETLVAMVVLSALGVGVWAAVTVSEQSVARSRASSRAATQVLQVDDRLRACVSRVRAPWWMPAPSIQGDDGSWNIPYLDGDPDKSLAISWKTTELSIDDGGAVSRYPGFTSARLTSALDVDGRPYGVELTLEGKYVSRISIIARFGSVELRARSEP